MRVFILSCLLATSLAIPQGYNYQQKQQNSVSFGLPQISSLFGSSTSQNSLHEGGGHQQPFGTQNYVQRPQPPIIPPSFGITPQIQPQQQAVFQQPQHQQTFHQPAPTVTKDIYVHVAPEEPEERHVQQQLPVAPPRKHYRIVFIKAPTQKISSNALRLQQAQSEEKTIIYVLTKKPDPLDLEAAIQEAAPKPPSKPEVYFIKYKTQEEAQHAQRTIQAQYDKLGGTTQISDEGVAPVTSVIGSLNQSQSGSGSSSFSTGSSGFNNVGVSSSYGAPLNAGNGASAIGSSGVSNENKYLPPIRI